MKLINRNNFISIVCISFTLIVCGKLLLEKSTGFIDRYYTENIFTCLAISVLATFVLSLHYYLQRFPFIPVVIGQYLALIGFVFLCIWIMGHFTENAPSAYKDMFVSVTIPYVAGAIVYYISFFRQIKRANEVFSNLESD
jgi:predicted tellurium resistance membrane protein TerC